MFSQHWLSSVEKISIIIFCIVAFFKIEAACVDSCAGKLLYPFTYGSCDDCTQFFTCDLFGQLTTHTCFNGYVYDDFLNICQPFFGSCSDYAKDETTPTTTTTTSTTTPTTTTTTTTTQLPTIPQKPSMVGQTLVHGIYIKILLVTSPCVANAPFYKSAPSRSNIECGNLCYHELMCWYFQLKDQQCLMYFLSLPPCNVEIYKYIG